MQEYYNIPIVPRQLRLELTNRCNAHCLTCHGYGINPMKRKKGDMERSLIEKCINDVIDFPNPLQECVLNNYGEMFAYPDWFKVMQFVSAKLPQTMIVLPTNGTYLNNDTVAKLATIKTLKIINVSVNAFSPELYHMFHDIDPKVLPMIANSLILLRKVRPDITIWVSMAHDPSYQSPKEVELFTEYWGQFGIVQINAAQYNNRPDRAPPIPVRFPCRSIFSDMVIFWDGKCSSCCFDADANKELYVGDASDESLISIWHGEKFNKIRSLHLESRRHEIEICRNCTFA